MKGQSLARGPISRRSLLIGAGAVALPSAAFAGCDLSLDPNSGGTGSGRRSAEPSDEREAPGLAALSKAGKLPPLPERLPEQPLVVEPVDRVGTYGGTWRNVISGSAETFFIAAKIGYDSLVSWTLDWSGVVPNLAESVESSPELTEYTFALRTGTRWSDGEPFTTADIEFAYDDVLSNPELYPAGVPQLYRNPSDGSPATLEVIDEQTVRLTFAEPNPLFLEHLATSSGASITGHPRHYLEQFHDGYGESVQQLVEDGGFADWIELFAARADRWGNPDLPTLYPWRIQNAVGDGDRLIAERNPYYWKTDPDGRQLPYLDKVSFNIVTDPEVILLQMTSGEYDMEPHYVVRSLANKPTLAQYRSAGNYKFFEMTNSSMNDMLISLNLTHNDPTLRSIFTDREFRIGLSHAIDREEIIQVVYQRQGEPGQSAPSPESKFYDEEMAKQYSEFDVAEAESRLDAAGYDQRDSDGFRLGPNGKRISFAIEVVSDRPWWINSLELIEGYWRTIGIDVRLRTEDRSLWSERTAANEHDACAWTGDAGLRDAILYAHWYAPINTSAKYAVGWGEWNTSRGAAGEKPPQIVRQQLGLYDELQITADEAARDQLFRELLEIAKSEFYTIGTVLPPKSFGLVRNDFHNVPESFFYSATYVFSGPTRCEQYFTTRED